MGPNNICRVVEQRITQKNPEVVKTEKYKIFIFLLKSALKAKLIRPDAGSPTETFFFFRAEKKIC
jgi:hypothetical protein